MNLFTTEMNESSKVKFVTQKDLMICRMLSKLCLVEKILQNKNTYT